MRPILLLIAIVFSSVSSFAQITYDNFDDIRISDYGFINGEFFPYTGNPAPGGVNSSLSCALYQRNPVELYDVLILETGLMEDLTPYVAGSKSITMDVFSPGAGITVQITLEDTDTALPANYPTGRHSEYTAVTTTAGQWETLTFELQATPDIAVPADGVERLVLLFNPGNTVLETYYWDNLNGPELQDPLCTEYGADQDIVNDFECNQSVSYTFTHGRFRRVPNPSMVGNTSSHAGRYERNAGEQDDVVLGTFSENLEITSTTTMSLDVYDLNAPSEVVLVLQDGDGNDQLVLTGFTEQSETWETLEFDLSSQQGNPNISKFVLLYSPGLFEANIIYYDNWIVQSPIGVEELESASVAVWPNPTNGQLSFKAPTNQNIEAVSVFDINGRAVKAQPINMIQGEIDLSDLNPGFYTVAFNLNNGSRITEKVIVK